MNDTNPSYSIVIKRAPDYNVLFITGMFSLCFVASLGFFLYLTITEFKRIAGDEFFLFLILWIFMGQFVLKLFLWNLRGKEQIIISGNMVSIKKLGTILTVPKTFELDQIDSFFIADKPVERIAGWGGGIIQFDYMDKPRYFGQRLPERKAKEVIEELNEQLRKQKKSRA